VRLPEQAGGAQPARAQARQEPSHPRRLSPRSPVPSQSPQGRRGLVAQARREEPANSGRVARHAAGRARSASARRGHWSRSAPRPLGSCRSSCPEISTCPLGPLPGAGGHRGHFARRRAPDDGLSSHVGRRELRSAGPRSARRRPRAWPRPALRRSGCSGPHRKRSSASFDAVCGPRAGMSDEDPARRVSATTHRLRKSPVTGPGSIS